MPTGGPPLPPLAGVVHPSIFHRALPFVHAVPDAPVEEKRAANEEDGTNLEARAEIVELGESTISRRKPNKYPAILASRSQSSSVIQYCMSAS